MKEYAKAIRRQMRPTSVRNARDGLRVTNDGITVHVEIDPDYAVIKYPHSDEDTTVLDKPSPSAVASFLQGAFRTLTVLQDE